MMGSIDEGLHMVEVLQSASEKGGGNIRPRFISDYFILDNFHSHAMGIEGCYIVSSDSGKAPMAWMGAQSVISNRLAGYDSPVTVKTQKENLAFSLVFSILDAAHLPTINYNLGRVFGKSVPVPLEISDDRQKMIYVLPTNQREIYTYMGKIGHFAIDFVATTPWWLTPIERINKTLQSGDIFIMENKSNVQNSDGTYDVFPFLKFTVFKMDKIITEMTNIVSQELEYVITEIKNEHMITEDSPPILTETTVPTFELIHLSDTPNRTIKFNNLEEEETIEMDSRLKQIQSSTGKNRFKNWNREVFRLHEGFNKFQTKYPVRISTSIQYPIYQ